jgi:hypothetical protein
MSVRVVMVGKAAGAVEQLREGDIWVVCASEMSPSPA